MRGPSFTTPSRKPFSRPLCRRTGGAILGRVAVLRHPTMAGASHLGATVGC